MEPRDRIPTMDYDGNGWVEVLAGVDRRNVRAVIQHLRATGILMPGGQPEEEVREMREQTSMLEGAAVLTETINAAVLPQLGSGGPEYRRESRMRMMFISEVNVEEELGRARRVATMQDRLRAQHGDMPFINLLTEVSSFQRRAVCRYYLRTGVVGPRSRLAQAYFSRTQPRRNQHQRQTRQQCEDTQRQRRETVWRNVQT